MSGISHRVIARGIEGPRVPLGAMRDLAGWLADGVDRAMRLRIEGRSSAPGPRPDWLVASNDVKIVALGKGSLVVEVESTPLHQLMPGVSGQTSPWDPTVADESPFDLFLDGLEDALAGRKDSDRIDSGWLAVMKEGKALLANHGIEEIGFESLSSARPTLTIDERRFGEVRTLLETTPQPQFTRIVGRLDGLIAKVRAFFLELHDGTLLRGVIPTTLEPASLGQWFQSEVVIEGQVLFKPSGSPLRIDATTIALADEADARWHRLPSGRPARLSVDAAPASDARLEDFFGALADVPVRDDGDATPDTR